MRYIITCIFLVVQINAFSQEPDPVSFFPSSVGNVWEYDTDHGFVRQEIVEDSVGIDGSRYLLLAPNTNPFFRIDTLNQVFYDPIVLNWLKYKLDAVLDESWIVYPEVSEPPGVIQRRDARVDSIYQVFLFGETRTVKEIGYYDIPFGDTVISDFGYFQTEYLVSGVGEYYTWNPESGPTRILKGCIVDGDTLGVISSTENEPDPLSFFPSSVGNIWEYDSENGFFRRELIKDSLLEDNSKLLFLNTLLDPAFRIDTLNQVFFYPTIVDWLYYKLDAVQGESWTVYPEVSEPPGVIQRRDARVDSVYQVFLFGETRTVKEIGFYDIPFGDTVISDLGYFQTEYLVSGVGEYYTWNPESGPRRILRGCIIDGDTLGVITSVNDKPVTVTDFRLQQNYPNPFNPVTIIGYSLPRSSDVTLVVYNILGEKVKVFNEGYKNAGNYEVVFNASNLPSGIYVYTLIADNFSSSKKMMLLK